MTCEVCQKLWQQYEYSVFEHVRLCSRLKLAMATNNDAASEALMMEVQAAENKRAEMRAALCRHESESGHHDTDVRVSNSAI